MLFESGINRYFLAELDGMEYLVFLVFFVQSSEQNRPGKPVLLFSGSVLLPI